MKNNFMLAQKKKIELEKWFEGQRINRDPGSHFVLDWIKLNAAVFREKWEKSLCKSCQFTTKCGFEVQAECKEFIDLRAFKPKQ